MWVLCSRKQITESRSDRQNIILLFSFFINYISKQKQTSVSKGCQQGSPGKLEFHQPCMTRCPQLCLKTRHGWKGVSRSAQEFLLQWELNRLSIGKICGEIENVFILFKHVLEWESACAGYSCFTGYKSFCPHFSLISYAWHECLLFDHDWQAMFNKMINLCGRNLLEFMSATTAFRYVSCIFDNSTWHFGKVSWCWLVQFFSQSSGVIRKRKAAYSIGGSLGIVARLRAMRSAQRHVRSNTTHQENATTTVVLFWRGEWWREKLTWPSSVHFPRNERLIKGFCCSEFWMKCM